MTSVATESAPVSPRPGPHAARTAGLGRPEHGHEPGLAARRPAHVGVPAAVRRRRPLAARPRRTRRRGRGHACSPTSCPAAPRSCGRGWRRCATSGSRSSPSRRSPRTPTSTTTCSRHIRAARRRGPAASTSSSRPATGGRSASRWRSCRQAGTYVTVIGFREHASFALTSEVIEFVDLEDIDGVFREPLPRITLDSLPDDGRLAAAVPLAALAAGAAGERHRAAAHRAGRRCPATRPARSLRDARRRRRRGRAGSPASARAPTRRPTRRAVRALPGALLPGLVNTHAHTPMAVLRGHGRRPAADALAARGDVAGRGPARPADDVRAGMIAGCVEMLRTGCTTSVEMYFFTDARDRRGDRRSGSRVRADARASSPRPAGTGWAPGSRCATTCRPGSTRDGLRSGAGRARSSWATARTRRTRCRPRRWPRSPSTPASAGALVHIHVAESPQEDAAQRAAHGSVPALLDELGVLGGRVLAAHAVQLSDADIALLGRARAPRSRTAPARTRSSPPGVGPGARRCAGPGSGSAWAPTARRPATTSTCGPRPGSPACWPG